MFLIIEAALLHFSSALLEHYSSFSLKCTLCFLSEPPPALQSPQPHDRPLAVGGGGVLILPAPTSGRGREVNVHPGHFIVAISVSPVESREQSFLCVNLTDVSRDPTFDLVSSLPSGCNLSDSRAMSETLSNVLSARYCIINITPSLKLLKAQ